jgi:two-component system heavy metal sensor histidine kinase CusS
VRPVRPFSLRARLTVSIVAVLVVVLGGFSALLYGAFSRALWRALDARLDTEAAALAEMAELDRGGRPRFEREGISGLADFEARGAPAYFQVWLPDGAVLARSGSLASADLRRPADAHARTILPDGRPGRISAAAFPAPWTRKGRPPAGNLMVAVARGTEREDHALSRLGGLLWALGALAVGVAAGAATWTVWRGLRPAAVLARALEGLDAGHLAPITVPDLPLELAPAVARLNELLGRLDESFVRERRFTADVSHELRTPLAGLRSLLEVAASRDRSAPEYRTVIEEAMDIVRQMHVLADDLLVLARVDANQLEVLDEPIALRPFIEECWRPFAARAAQRGLVFDNRVSGDITRISDRDKLRLVLRNILSNAVSYTAAGGRIEVSADPAVIDVCDSGPPIPEATLPRLFERFFRGDTARTVGGGHAGIGLAVVAALCKPLGLLVTAANTTDGGVRFRLAREARA